MNPEKHLLPKDIFVPDTRPPRRVKECPTFPYPSIDIIFNHKNIWANLQNPNPQRIKFHLHKVEDWMPLVTDFQPREEHPRRREKQRRADPDKNNKEEPEEEDDDDHPRKGKKGKKGGNADLLAQKMFEAKCNGDLMKPFPSFYDAQALEPPLTAKQVDKLENKIIKEVENSIKQVRSSVNLLANMKNSRMTRTALRKYLDYLEDEECLRLSKPESAHALVRRDLMKLVPPDHKIALLPAFFNHTDGDRIGTVIRDAALRFLVEPKKDVMFSVAVKIFPYASEINSVRVVLVKYHEVGGNDAGEEGGSGAGSRRSRSRKSGSNKSRSNKSRKSKAGGSQKGDIPQDLPPKK